MPIEIASTIFGSLGVSETSAHHGCKAPGWAVGQAKQWPSEAKEEEEREIDMTC